MDDDVAYYNTNRAYLEDDTFRAERISRFSIEGTENTVYKIKIKMIDHTKKTLGYLRSYISDIYNEYKDYVDEARDICSFNNITNTYNDHFVQALNEKYIVQKPWIKAAYAAVALSDMYYGGEGALSKDEFDAKTIRQVLKISPGTGTLTATIAFKDTLSRLMNYLMATDDLDGTINGPGEAIVGGNGEALFFGKEIDFVKYSSINGEYFPSQGVGKVDDVWEDPREIAPLIVIPDVIFFGGADFTITFTETKAISDGDTDTLAYEAFAGYVGLVGDREIVGADDADIFEKASVDGYFSDTGGTSVGGDPRFTADEGTVRPAEAIRYSRGESISADVAKYVPIVNPNKNHIVRDAYDEIFLPYNTDDWRAKLFGVFASAGGGLTVRPPSLNVNVYVKGLGLRALNQAERLSIIPGMISDADGSIPGRTIRFGFYEGSRSSPDLTFSNAGRLAHEILARSSVDVHIRNKSGSGLFSSTSRSTSNFEGRRLGWNNRVSGRRSRRSLTHLVYLIKKYYLPEARRRIREEDTARYSEIVTGRQNFEEFALRAKYMFGETSASRTAAAIDFHENVEEVLELIVDKLELEIETGRGDDDLEDRRSATYGICDVVHDPTDGSHELYTGPGFDPTGILTFDPLTNAFED
jgi:hypothetical protein